MAAVVLAKRQHYYAPRCSLCSSSPQTGVGFRLRPESDRWSHPRWRVFGQGGTLTRRAPSGRRRSSLRPPPSGCRTLAPDRTPQTTALSPGTRREEQKNTHYNSMMSSPENSSKSSWAKSFASCEPPEWFWGSYSLSKLNSTYGFHWFCPDIWSQEDNCVT